MFLAVHRTYAAQHLRLLFADRFGDDARRRLHRDVREHLEEVVLDHVADDARLVVELAAPFHAERLGHRDLDVLDVVAVEDRLEERVGETEVEEVLHRLFAEVVVDAEDRRLGEDLVQCVVE